MLGNGTGKWWSIHLDPPALSKGSPFPEQAAREPPFAADVTAADEAVDFAFGLRHRDTV
jgi:hypothetical protein